MYLKSVEINGFKSFANKINIEFKDGITSIVGPNGSGKSNILDAILWALGEQSNKNIRAKSGTDVIFSGGKNYNPKNMAEVSLLIDNSSKFLLIDFSEIKITRRIYRTGENEYFINNNKVRLKDINDLFTDTGIGKEAYSVIGQGKVEQIIMSTPQELKNIIEEAAGIKKIKKKKEDSQDKLVDVKNNIEKIEYIEENVKENLLPLEEKAKKTMLFKELSSKKNKLEISLYKKKLFNIEELLKNYEIKICEKNDLIADTESSIKKENEEYNKIILERESKQLKIIELEKKYNDKKVFLNNLNNNKTLYNERKSNYIRENSEKDELIIRNKEKLNKINLEINKISEKEKNLKENLNLNSGVSDSLLTEKTVLQNKLNSYEENLKTLKNKIMEIEIEKVKNTGNTEYNSKSLQIINNKIIELKKEINNYEISKDDKILEVKEINLNKKNNLEKIDNLNINLKKNKEDLLLKNNTLSEIQNKINELKTLIQSNDMKLKNLDNLEKNNEGFFKGVKEVLNAGIIGVIGPVISLINIPEKFETAIESIAGNSLQDIVVEHSDVAKEAINLLKKNNLGRASFLPFDTIKDTPSKPSVKTDGVYGIASDLVKYDQKYEKIINYVLGNILIVENIDIGIDILKNKKFNGNIVSIDGEILNSSGKITGGQKFKSNISFLFDRQKEKKNILNNNINLNMKLEVFEKNTFNLNNEILTIKNLELSYLSEIELLIKEKVILENKLNVEENNFNILEKRGSLLKFELMEEEKNLFKITEDMKKNSINSENYLLNLETTKKLIKDIEEKIHITKSNIEKLNISYNDIHLIIKKDELNYNSILESIEKNLEEKSQIEDDLSKITIRKNYIKDEVNHLVKSLEQIEKDIVDNSLKIKTYFEELERLKIENNNLETFEKNKILIIKDLENKISSENNTLYRYLREKENHIDNQKEFLSFLENIGIDENIFMTENEVQTEKDISNLQVEIEKIGEINLLAINEYEELKEKYDFLLSQKQDLINSKKSLNDLIINIEKEIIEKFLEAYESIKDNFSHMCSEVLNNSKGDIIISDEKDLLNTGLELIVKFQNKKSQTLNLLSGGEKSMVAFAFIMAVFMFKPSPFTFFDEIEAALDETNTKKMIAVLKSFTNESQFILITHNKETMKESDVLYGVTMNKEIGVSKLITVEL